MNKYDVWADAELLIEYSKGEYWRWRKAGKEDFYEEVDQDKLSELQPQSIFEVGYNSSSAAHLIAFLECILARYGGWVLRGNWDNLYTVDNIRSLIL